MKTLSLVLGLTCLPLVASAPVARAHPEPVPVLVAPHARPAIEDYDYVLGGLSSLVGGAVVGGAGFGLGYALGSAIEPPCGEDAWLCFRGLGTATLLSALATPAGMAAGMSLYGDARGFDGSYWGALGGAYVGTATGIGLGALIVSLDADGGAKDARNGVAVAVGLFTAAAGTTIGYFLTTGDGDPAAAALPQALIQVDRAGAVSLAPPGLALEQRPGDTRLTVTLLGGAL
ncbi:MAG: hypothetical protein IT385_14080 [Deltaproteobacteria bacterium]|nr:hypothetical protein [Deltaproteobacteria bacterium]